jgi:hypothetical protein
MNLNLLDPQPRELFFLGSASDASPLGSLPSFSLPDSQPAPVYSNSSIFIIPHAGFSLIAWPFAGVKVAATDFRSVFTSGFTGEKLQTLWNVVPATNGSVQFADIHGSLCLEVSESDNITSECFNFF